MKTIQKFLRMKYLLVFLIFVGLCIFICSYNSEKFVNQGILSNIQETQVPIDKEDYIEYINPPDQPRDIDPSTQPYFGANQGSVGFGRVQSSFTG